MFHGRGDAYSANFDCSVYRVPVMRIIVSLFLMPMLLASQAALAQQENAGSTASAFMKCARIANDAQRLSCYDRLATELIELGLSNLETPAPAPAAPPSAPARAAAAAPSVQDDRGEGPTVITGRRRSRRRYNNRRGFRSRTGRGSPGQRHQAHPEPLRGGVLGLGRKNDVSPRKWPGLAADRVWQDVVDGDQSNDHHQAWIHGQLHAVRRRR